MTSAPDDPPVLPYPFRFVDPLTGKWVRARYRATRQEIEQRCAKWEITGMPEIIGVRSSSFNPYG
jgi:hypothetical protein